MIGVDEVGRGCWAGPLLVVAARQIAELPAGVADSKVLSKKRRQLLSHDVKLACNVGEGWVSATEIDTIGLGQAMYVAVERALTALDAKPDEEIIMDGNVNYCPAQYAQAQCIIDADATHPIVSAASIYAKVLRDNYMATAAQQHPQYMFEKHVGYGTKAHLLALKQYGLCELHRLSYQPLKEFYSDYL